MGCLKWFSAKPENGLYREISEDVTKYFSSENLPECLLTYLQGGEAKFAGS